MKLVCVSDAHGDDAILTTIVTQQPDADGYFYAGDSELPVADAALMPYRTVGGNMDFDAGFDQTVTATIGDLVVFMAHGHRYAVGFDLTALIEAGQHAHANLVVFGHTHQLGVEQHAGMVLLNPGSIAQPRGQFAHLGGTYAVVTTTASELTVTYHLRDGAVVPELTRTFTR